jgi:hypothetical protein
VKRRRECINRLKTHHQEDKQDNQFSHNLLSIPCSILFRTRTQYINEREACKTYYLIDGVHREKQIQSKTRCVVLLSKAFIRIHTPCRLSQRHFPNLNIR